MSATSIALTLVFVLSVAAISWAISRGPIRGRSGIAGRAFVGVAVGVVVGGVCDFRDPLRGGCARDAPTCAGRSARSNAGRRDTGR